MKTKMFEQVTGLNHVILLLGVDFDRLNGQLIDRFRSLDQLTDACNRFDLNANGQVVPNVNTNGEDKRSPVERSRSLSVMRLFPAHTALPRQESTSSGQQSYDQLIKG